MKIDTGYRMRSVNPHVSAVTRRLAVPKTAPASAPTLEALITQLLEEQLAGVEEAGLRVQLRRAAAESASLAWSTAFPLLALPELLAEKGREARRHYERQRVIQNSTRAAFSLSA